jgi:hypothetical protein
MIEGVPFLYQARDGTVYHVNEKAVQVIQLWPHNEPIVAFVDADKKGYEPHHMLLVNGNVRIILASSPKVKGLGWIKQSGSVDVIATELWSPRELFNCGYVLGGYSFQHSTDAFL